MCEAGDACPSYPLPLLPFPSFPSPPPVTVPSIYQGSLIIDKSIFLLHHYSKNFGNNCPKMMNKKETGENSFAVQSNH